MIRRLSLFTRLTLGFLLVLLVTLAVGQVGMNKIVAVFDITENLHNHPFTVSSALLDLRGNIHEMRANFLRILDGEEKDIGKVAEVMAAIDQKARTDLDLAGERYLGPNQDVQQLAVAYGQWRDAAFAATSLLRAGKQEEAMRLYHEQILPYRQTLLDATDKMVAFATKRAARFMDEARTERDRAMFTMAALLVCALLVGAAMAVLVIRSITSPVQQLVTLARDLARGRDLKEQPVLYNDEIGHLEQSFNAIIAANNQMVEQARTIAAGTYPEEIRLRSAEDTLGIALRGMTAALAARERESQAESWLKTGQNQLGERMRSDQELQLLATAVVGFLAERLHSQLGCLYLLNEKAGKLRLQGCHACTAEELPAEFALGEGLVGQGAADGRTLVLSDLPADYLRIGSAVGATLPRHLLIVPFLFEERLLGVVELASLIPFTELEQEFVARAGAILGSGFNLALARREMQQLLQTTLLQAEELQVQQEELSAINEELEEQTQALKISAELLKEQQEELRVTNEELEEKTQDLELQREKILLKNRELEAAQLELEQQKHDLETASRYKSDFLANMSHELRTPLNSLLILARDLEENRAGNLLPPQVQSAEVIHKSGIDLLNLINDILDLAKIEAGRMELNKEEVEIEYLLENLRGSTSGLFLNKPNLELVLEVEPDLPQIYADHVRVTQVLNNLVSNAVKFTDAGRVTVRAFRQADYIHIAVTDQGIGISEKDLETIFERFRQVDGSFTRRAEGTGLGLPITQHLVRMHGGELLVDSEFGVGSTFTVTFPIPTPSAEDEVATDAA